MATWPDGSIVFVCPVAAEPWGPWSVEGGIGGSEEAVIWLSRLLSRRGWRCTVFGQPGERGGMYDGVEWRSIYEWERDDQFDVLVIWRLGSLYQQAYRARLRLLWLHDVPETGIFSPELLPHIDRIIVLSGYHRALLREAPDEKVWVSANGIDPSQFAGEERRHTQRLIYSSSPDRGLEHLADMWPRIRQAVPPAELHVFYGWQTFDTAMERTPEPRRIAWKEQMLKRLQQPGIVDHGRVGHGALAHEFLRGGVWAYPCSFPEISCITAMKAQAGGAVPLTTDYAALPETVRFGVQVSGPIANPEVQEQFREELVSLLSHPRRQEHIRQQMVPAARAAFAWERVAEEWDGRLRRDEA